VKFKFFRIAAVTQKIEPKTYQLFKINTKMITFIIKSAKNGILLKGKAQKLSKRAQKKHNTGNDSE
jgi:hypothetical protein